MPTLKQNSAQLGESILVHPSLKSEAALARVDVDPRPPSPSSRTQSFSNQRTSGGSSPSAGGDSRGEGSKGRSVTRTVSSFFKGLFKPSSDGAAGDASPVASKSFTSRRVAASQAESPSAAQPKRQNSLSLKAFSSTSASAPPSPQPAPPSPAQPAPKKPPSPVAAQQPAAHPAKPAEKTVLLAVAPNLPPSMQRAVWSLKDYAVVRRGRARAHAAREQAREPSPASREMYFRMARCIACHFVHSCPRPCPLPQVEKMYTGYASTVYKAWCKHSGDTVCLKAYNLSNL